MNKKSLLTLLFTAAISLSLGASAVAAKGYGAAGCGLGSIVFGNKPGLVQVLAATTNGTFYSQTLGITSGTSNCSDSGAFQEKQREVFAAVNMSGLEQEMAAGKGEKLTAFANLFGCPVSSAEQFGSMTRKNFEKLVRHTDEPSSLVKMIKQNIASDKTLAVACRI